MMNSRKLIPGIQLPSIIQNDENLPEEETNIVIKGEEITDWMVLGEEYALAAEMNKSEALELWSLVEAKASPDWMLWKKAIDNELAVIKAARTWELVDTPPGVNIVSSKWVF